MPFKNPFGQIIALRIRQVNRNASIDEDIFISSHLLSFIYSWRKLANHWRRSGLYLIIIHILVFLEILDLLHHLTEHFWCIPWRIAVLDKANLYIQLQLFTYIIIVEPIGKGRFCINDLSNLTCKTFTLIIDNNTIHLLVFSVFEVILIS